MGSLSSAEQRKLAYFHALGKAMTENTQAVYESKYKSSHNVRLDETWSDDVAFANTYVDAVTESNTNDAVTLFEEVLLTEIFGSNGQSYNYYSGGTVVRASEYMFSTEWAPYDPVIAKQDQFIHNGNSCSIGK